MSETTKETWPDLSRDARAWELAKIALGISDTSTLTPEETTALVTTAQEIKKSLCKSKLRHVKTLQ